MQNSSTSLLYGSDLHDSHLTTYALRYEIDISKKKKKSHRHLRLRQKVERKCLEMKHMMEAEQFNVEDVENRIAIFRNMLLLKEGLVDLPSNLNLNRSSSSRAMQKFLRTSSKKCRSKKSSRSQHSERRRSSSVTEEADHEKSADSRSRSVSGERRSPSSRRRSHSVSRRRSMSIRRRRGSPSHLDRRRITSSRYVKPRSRSRSYQQTIQCKKSRERSNKASGGWRDSLHN